MSTLDVAAFLARIGYAGPCQPTATALSGIHWAHLQAVPFENLDIRPLNRAIDFDLAALQDKIVRRRRGGFCFELNGLLAEVLREIGFEVDRVSVQFIRPETESPPFDHMGLLVRPRDEPTTYLVDVGCGRTSPARPLLLRDGNEEFQPETLTAYRLRLVDGWWQLHRRPEGEDWQPEYTFAETPHEQNDFAGRCRFLDSHPDSPFTQAPLCSRNLPGGRVTLTDHRLIYSSGAERWERELSNRADFHDALRDHFGIDLSLEGAFK